MGRRVIKKREGSSTDPMMGDPAFDRWVARQLHKIYDEVLAEEIPDELLRVVDGLEKDASGGETDGPDDTPGGGGRRHGTTRGR